MTLSTSQLKGGELDEKYVKSCRVCTSRSVRGLCLPPAISRAERREVERVLVDALARLGGDLAGQYHPLNKISKEQEKQLVQVSAVTPHQQLPACLYPLYHAHTCHNRIPSHDFQRLLG